VAAGRRPPRVGRWGRTAHAAPAGTAAASNGSCVAKLLGGPAACTVDRCPICLDDIVNDAGLQCGHGACTECIVRFIESQVKVGKVAIADLCCPLTACRLPMPDYLITELLLQTAEGDQLLERLLEFQARRFVPRPCEGESLIGCPGVGCGKVLVPSELVAQSAEITCPTCGRAFCAGCCEDAHPGQSCEAAELQRMDPELRRPIAMENLKRCLACRFFCERESGCNFMTCPSEVCQGKTHFCYICSALLQKAEHASHYQGFEGAIGRMGPFGSVCLNKRNEDLSLPARPPSPMLSVVVGDLEGSIVLRISWGPHKSEPPTIYYRIRLWVPGTDEVKHVGAQAGEPHHDFRGIRRYRRYQASVTPVNVNGSGPTSEPSEIIHFHPRELKTGKDDKVVATTIPKIKRWAPG